MQGSRPFHPSAPPASVGRGSPRLPAAPWQALIKDQRPVRLVHRQVLLWGLVQFLVPCHR